MTDPRLTPCDGSHKPRRLTSPTERFWRHVTAGADDECWEWQGAHTREGYGRMGRGRRGEGWFYAHRLSWEIHRGSVPEGSLVLHRCDNPACCNPGHLWLGNQADNMADMAQKKRVAARYEHSHPRTKLTLEDIAWARELREAGFLLREIAERFNVTVGCISRALSGKRVSA